MTIFQICAILLTITACGGYINHRFIRLPDTIGQMALALFVSIALLILNEIGWVDASSVKSFIQQIDFSELIINGMLSLLLFAGALHINMTDLRKVRWSVGLLSTFGVIIATFISGTLIWYASQLVNLPLDLPHAFIFGALISPTDPIAVLSMLKKGNVSKKMHVKIGAESLFNDGVGIVLFITLSEMASLSSTITPQDIFVLFARETFGALALGGLLGWLTFRLLRPINDYKTEIMLTIALVMGGAVLAEHLHVSVPICAVTSGLITGNHSIKKGMQQETRKRLGIFWDLIDEIMNSLLFVLIGLKIFTLDINLHHVLLGLVAIVIVLVSRFVSVSIPITLIRLKRRIEHGTIALLTWGGLRGGLSIAMALSLPSSPEKHIIVPVAYIVVLFSILVQGLTFPWAIRIFATHPKGKN